VEEGKLQWETKFFEISLDGMANSKSEYCNVAGFDFERSKDAGASRQ
jgi:putative hemolysin